MTYALGRILDAHDRPAVRRIVATAAADEHRFSAHRLGIVMSPQFRSADQAHDGGTMSHRDFTRTSRRTLLAAGAGLAGRLRCADRAQRPRSRVPMPRCRAEPTAAAIAAALPLDTLGLEHIGTVVPDVTRAARFYSRVFNPVLYKERDEPLRYYVTLDPGYIALGSRANETRAFIDHDCALLRSYDRAAMARRLEAEGLPAGRFGVIPDPDGLGLQLLGAPGGLAGSTVAGGPSRRGRAARAAARARLRRAVRGRPRALGGVLPENVRHGAARRRRRSRFLAPHIRAG